MFGMILIANVLTSRTVQTLANWMTPFAELHSGESTRKSREAFDRFKERILEIENEIVEDNSKTPYPYFHLQPSHVDISISI